MVNCMISKTFLVSLPLTLGLAAAASVAAAQQAPQDLLPPEPRPAATAAPRPAAPAQTVDQAFDDIIRRQPLPGYTLFLETEIGGRVLLAFEPSSACGQSVDGLVLSGTRTIVPSGTHGSCYREPKQPLSHRNKSGNLALNLESNTESNFEERRRDVESLIAKAGATLKSGARKGKLTHPKQGSLTSTNTPELPLGKPGGRR